MQTLLAMIASMTYLEILILAIICSLFLCRLSSKNGLPWNWPMVGMLPGIFFHLYRLPDKCSEILERCKGTFLIKGVWFANMDMLLTSDPANVHYVMSKNFSNYPKGSESKNIFDTFGDGIFTAEFDEWRSQRKSMHAVFNHQRFRQFTVKVLRDNLERGLIPVLEQVSKQGILVDFQDVLARLMFDDSCMLTTGYNPCSLRVGFPEAPFIKAMDEVCEAIFFRHILPMSFWKLQRWLQVGKERKLRNACKTLDHIAAKYLSMKREELTKGTKLKDDDEECFDALRFYLTELEVVGSIPTDKILKDNLLGLIFGGRDTTSAVLTWFFWLLSNNPLVETKIKEELQSKFPTKEGEKVRLFYKEEISNLVYLHGALSESLRLFPSGPFQHRTPLQPDTLPSGHHVNPKTKVMLSAYAMGRMAAIWGKDCLEFKPERWISEGGIKHEPSNRFFAFSAGPRICLGKELAFTRMKTIIATIIHNYHVEVVAPEGQPVTLTPSIILRMKHGLMARVKKRHA